MQHYSIYWLIDEKGAKTYVGFSGNLEKRLQEHATKKVKSTKNFGAFKCIILEKKPTESEAKKRERYWKSSAGRKKLKAIYSSENFTSAAGT